MSLAGFELGVFDYEREPKNRRLLKMRQQHTAPQGPVRLPKPLPQTTRQYYRTHQSAALTYFFNNLTPAQLHHELCSRFIASNVSS